MQLSCRIKIYKNNKKMKRERESVRLYLKMDFSGFPPLRLAYMTKKT